MKQGNKWKRPKSLQTNHLSWYRFQFHKKTRRVHTKEKKTRKRRTKRVDTRENKRKRKTRRRRRKVMTVTTNKVKKESGRNPKTLVEAFGTRTRKKCVAWSLSMVVTWICPRRNWTMKPLPNMSEHTVSNGINMHFANVDVS